MTPFTFRYARHWQLTKRYGYGNGYYGGNGYGNGSRHGYGDGYGYRYRYGDGYGNGRGYDK